MALRLKYGGWDTDRITVVDGIGKGLGEALAPEAREALRDADLHRAARAAEAARRPG